jgi:hypothetical protein
MNRKLWFRKTLSMSLAVAVFATSSMFALAGTSRVAGELTVTGSQSSTVTVNGEAAKSGRSIFTASIISTPENAGAVVNLGKSGVIELAPNTTFEITFDEKSVGGNLSAGKLTVLSAIAPVDVKTASGRVVAAGAGESVSAAAGRQDDDDDDGGAAWWLWALVFGGAAAGILIAATQADNDVNLGGTGTVVSPVR